ncbi:MAG: hypothetical protein IPP40_02250 [bacterium]|nr:hypothetical protein [bacterium]
MVLSLLLVFACALMRVRQNGLLAAVRSAWLLIAIAAVFHLVFRIWFVGEQDQTILNSVVQISFFLCRLILLTFMTFVVLKVNSPAEYAESVASRMRFVVGKKLAGNAGHISMLALSMLPQLQEHMNQRKLARILRRIQPSRKISSRFDQAQTDLGAAFRCALEYANIVAIVLWSRGFRAEHSIQLSSRRSTSQTGLLAAIAFCLLSLCTLLPKRIG